MTESLPVSRNFNPRKNYPFLSSKFKRRCPMHFFYLPVECPQMKNCENGMCPLAHTKLEVIFHPILHKTKRCSMSLLNVCNFAQRCAFYHNTNDRISSHLSWLVWQKKWSLWETAAETLAARFDLTTEVARKLSYMIESRIASQIMFESLRRNPKLLSRLQQERQLAEGEEQPSPPLSESGDEHRNDPYGYLLSEQMDRLNDSFLDKMNASSYNVADSAYGHMNGSVTELLNGAAADCFGVAGVDRINDSLLRSLDREGGVLESLAGGRGFGNHESDPSRKLERASAPGTPSSEVRPEIGVFLQHGSEDSRAPVDRLSDLISLYK